MHKQLLNIKQPFFNNNGSDNLTFDPFGSLVVGLGDGGASHDPFNLAQNKRSVLGKLLNINLDKFCTDCDVYPISDFSDLPPCQKDSIRDIMTVASSNIGLGDGFDNSDPASAS